MNKSKDYRFLLQNISYLKGVGIKTKKLLKKKKIEKVSDLLWNFPHDFTDRTNLKNLDVLEIGKIATIKVKVVKYSFPRIRNLPNKIFCIDETGKIDIVYFNSREGYIRKIFPLNAWVIISGKVNYFKKKYQITNPSYVVPLENENYVKKIIPKYPLTEGITEKIYRRLIDQVIINIPELNEWHSTKILKKLENKSWKDSVLYLHDPENIQDINSIYYKRLAYDEILANLIVMSQIRRRIKKIKKESKFFANILANKLKKNDFTVYEDSKGFDLYAINANIQKGYLFEIKTITNDNFISQTRSAIIQLQEYLYFNKQHNKDKIFQIDVEKIIVFSEDPTKFRNYKKYMKYFNLLQNLDIGLLYLYKNDIIFNNKKSFF